MKKQKFNKKLFLNKESIANLNSSEMKKINGGNQQHATTGLVTEEPTTGDFCCSSLSLAPPCTP